jgi:hypothetical protein
MDSIRIPRQKHYELQEPNLMHKTRLETNHGHYEPISHWSMLPQWETETSLTKMPKTLNKRQLFQAIVRCLRKGSNTVQLNCVFSRKLLVSAFLSHHLDE